MAETPILSRTELLAGRKHGLHVVEEPIEAYKKIRCRSYLSLFNLFGSKWDDFDGVAVLEIPKENFMKNRKVL
jgi:hypothetical protein